MQDKDFVEDPRYKVATREAWMAIAIFFLNFLWWFAFAYGMGDKPPQQYDFIFGFPAWFFWSVIGGYIIFSGIVYVMVRFFYTEMPLGKEPGDSWKPGRGE